MFHVETLLKAGAWCPDSLVRTCVRDTVSRTLSRNMGGSWVGNPGWKHGWKPLLETPGWKPLVGNPVLLKNKKYRAYQISKYPHPYTLYAPPPKTTPSRPNLGYHPSQGGGIPPYIKGCPEAMVLRDYNGVEYDERKKDNCSAVQDVGERTP